MAENKIEVLLTAKDKASGAIKKNTQAMKGMTGASKTLGKSLSVLKGIAITAVGVAGIGAITLAIKKSISLFAVFEVALNRLGNVSDKTIKSMRKEILSLSSSLGSVTTLTQGYYQVMSAGITETDKAMKMLRVSAKLSLESTIAQAEAVKGLAAVMGAYSDEVKTATEAADLLYTIEKSGITSVGELIPLIGNLANLAKAVGLSSNEMAAGLAQITTTGAGTAISVTQLQSLLTAISKRFKDFPPKIQAYGTAINAVKALGFQGVLKEIMHYTEGNSTVLVRMLGRQEGFLALLQLSKNEFKDYGDRLDSMTDKAGAFDDAWKRYSETLTAIWSTFKNTVGRQAILLGEKLAPKIKEIIEGMAIWIEKNDDLIAQKLPEYVDKLTKGLDDVLWVASKVAWAMGIIKDTMDLTYKALTPTPEVVWPWEYKKPEPPKAKFYPVIHPPDKSGKTPGGLPLPALPEQIDYKQTDEMKAKYAEYYATLEEMEDSAYIRTALRERKRLDELKPFIAARLSLKEAEMQEILNFEEELEDEALRMARETAEYQKELSDEKYNYMKDAMKGWASGFSSTLNDMLWGAEVTFREIAESFGKMITQMMIQKSIIEPLFEGGSGWIGKGLGAIGGLLSGGTTAATPPVSTGAYYIAAKGGVFPGGIDIYSNQVVKKPTQFAFASGAGLMGEAGPEAIMPLTRTPDGELGVKGEGGGGTTIIINAIDTKSFAEVVERNPGSIVNVISDALEGRTDLLDKIRETI